MNTANSFQFSKFQHVFWDFDGVIKESLDVKADVFVSLFADQPIEIQNRVREYHLTHGGQSRFEKFRLFLDWSGQPNNAAAIDELAAHMNTLVIQKVIECDWVPGAEAIIRNNPHKQFFHLVSATPHSELVEILRQLDLLQAFASVNGQPNSKEKVIADTIERLGLETAQCLMIGDARADYHAAINNKITFLLRRHRHNVGMDITVDNEIETFFEI